MKKILFIFFIIPAFVFCQDKIPKKQIDTTANGLVTNYKHGTDSNNLKQKNLGKIFDIIPVASSSSLYTDTSPQSVFTFTSGGITVTSGNSDLLNWIEYTGWTTNASYYTHTIVFTGTVDGDGLGVGINSANGKQLGQFIMTGGDRGKIEIETYRSGTTYNRITSTAALSYSNGTDLIRMTLTKSMYNYKLYAQIVGSSNIITIEWTDPLANGSISSEWSAGKPAIYHIGGSQTITEDYYSVDMPMQSDLLIYGNSIAAGAFAGSADNMYSNILSGNMQGGVSLIAGGGNQTFNYLTLKPEIFALKPKCALFTDGINDIINSVSLATIEANITTFIRDCIEHGVIPIVATVLPVSLTYTNASTINSNVATLNTWINALTSAKVIDTYTAVASGTVINPLYTASDSLHLNQAGNRVYAETVMSGIRNIVKISNVLPATDDGLGSYRTTNNKPGVLLYQLINPNAGTTSSSGIRILSDVATGYFNTYSSLYSTLPGYANKTSLANNTAGLVVSAFGVSGDISFLTAGQSTTTNNRFYIGSNGNVGVGGIIAPTAAFHLPPSVTGKAALRFQGGITPTTLNNGDVWLDTTVNHLYSRINGVSYQLDQQAVGAYWNVTGNTLLSRVTNYLGSSDSSQVRIKSNNLDALVVDSSQRVSVGSVATTARLGITDITLAGSGSLAGSVLDVNQTWNTSGTVNAINLNVTNTASNAASKLLNLKISNSSKFNINNIGTMQIGSGGGSFIFPTDGVGTPTDGGASLRFSWGGSTQVGFGYIFRNFNITNTTQTSGSNGTIRLIDGFAPTSGTGTYTVISSDATINQTGGASGITRGFFVNNTITAAADWRSVEIAPNAGYGLYQSGSSAKNYFNGITGVGAVPVTDKLEVTGNISLTTLGNKLKIAAGTNGSLNSATLVAGTVTVSNTSVTTSSRIIITVSTPGGTQGFLSVPVASIVNGTSFVVNSTSSAETSAFNYLIIN